MFADLLDSSPVSACGPELEFFCNRNLYDFTSFKRQSTRQSELFAVGSTGIFPRYNRLVHYGLSDSVLKEMIDESDSLESFQKSFASRFIEVRGKDPESIVFEKTPQNANAVDLWLEASSDNHFVFLTRDPLYVINSLMNRGWSEFTAIVTWLSYYGKVSRFLSHERCHHVKLEDVVLNPFEVTASLINSIHGKNATNSAHVEESYANNTYRKESSKRKSEWEVQDVGTGIMDPNAKTISETRLDLYSRLGSARLSKTYAGRFNLDITTLRSATESLGYSTDLFQIENGSLPRPNLKDYQKFLMKTLRSISQGHGKLGDVAMYAGALD